MPNRPFRRPLIGGQGNDPQPPARRRRGNNAGAWIAGLTAGIDSLQQQNDRKRHQELDKMSLEDRIASRQDRAADREATRAERRRREEMDKASLDARLRGDGYVRESEAGPDVTTPISGKSLDELVNAVSATPGFTGGLKDMTPTRYGEEVGGYRYDRMSPAARRERADADWAEHRIERHDDNEPEGDKTPSWSERNTRAIRERIDELTGQGVPLAEANRRARLEAGGSAPSLESRVGMPSESPEARDHRRAADRDRLALNQTNREAEALRRQMGKFPSATDSSSGRVKRLEDLVARGDSLRGEFDKHSAAANAATLGRYGVSASPAGPAAPNDSTRGSALERDLAEARRAFDATLKIPGVDSAAARTRYRDLVAFIRAKHQQQNDR